MLLEFKANFLAVLIEVLFLAEIVLISLSLYKYTITLSYITFSHIFSFMTDQLHWLPFTICIEFGVSFLVLILIN